jgi:pimeloyl-ACP methyl ester carboxylesterase
MTGAARAFVAVGGRRVHYRVLGDGPPLVMLHGSPADSELLEGEMAASSARYTCIAFDTPGFGHSDPLPGEELTMRDLAAATVEAMRALGLPPCAVYGTHTGAAIAIEIGVGWPEAVTGLVLEGLPAFTDEEIAALFPEHYFAPLRPSPLGGHLFDTWMRFRDQFTWFPWYSRDVTRLNAVDRPEPADIDHWVSMFYRSCKTYRAAYRAACFYGSGALRAAAALTVPAVYMASAEDMLFPHLDRLPALKAGQRIVRLPYDTPAKHRAIADLAASLPSLPSLPSPPSLPALPSCTGTRTTSPPVVVGQDPGLCFVPVASGHVLVRAFGDPSQAPLLVLHDAPGTGLASVPLARALVARYHVLVPDLPGNGESDAPPDDTSVLEAAADAVQEIVDAFGLARYAVLAIGCGAAVAAKLAERGDARLAAIVLDRVTKPDERRADAIAPDLTLAPDGSHWLRAWLMLRDAQIYDPWFDGRVAAQRPGQGDFDADALHDQTRALMVSRETYHRFPREAATFDVSAALALSATPTFVAAGRPIDALVLALDPFPGDAT